MKNNYLFRNVALLVLLFFSIEGFAQVLWYGNPNLPLKDSFYNLNREPGEAGTATTINDPVHGKVWRINKPAGSKRTEFARTTGNINNYKINNGDRVYVGWRVKVNVAGSNKPNGGFAIFQLKTQGNLLQNHPVSIDYDASAKRLNVQGITPGTGPVSPRKISFCTHSMNENTWTTIVLGFKFSKNANVGFVEVWINGVKQNLLNQNSQKQSYHRTHEEGLMYFKWGAYNETSRNFNITVDMDEMRVGTTLASVLNHLQSNVPGNPIVHMTKRNAPGYALDAGWDGANNQNVKLYASNTSNVNQQWEEINRGGGFYSYKKLNTNYCLDGGNDGANGQNVKLWLCSATNHNQHWKKINAGNDHYRLQKRNASGFSIDGGNGGANQQNVKIWGSNSSNENQQWKFTAVGTLKSAFVGEVERFFVEDEGSLNNVIVYPIPTSDKLNIEFGGDENEQAIVRIYDLLGAMVLTRKIDSQNNSLSVNHLSRGVYVIQVSSKDFNYNGKIIIE